MTSVIDPVAGAAALQESLAVAGTGALPEDLAYHRPGEPGYRRVILALFAAGVAIFATLYSTQPLIGVLARRFALPASHAAWSVSITTLLLGCGIIAAGPLSERWGRTRTIKGSLLATALLGGVCALAPSWPVLLAARAAQGLALAGTPAVALVYLREEIHASFHARATGLYVAGTALGGMTGRLISGGVADLAGWRAALAAVAALSGLCALAVIFVLPDPRHRARIRHRARSGDQKTATGSGSSGWREALSLSGRVLRDCELLALNAIAGSLMGAFVAIYNVLGLRLEVGPYHLSVFDASLVFCVYPLGSVSSALAGRLAERFGRPLVVLAGSLAAACGVALTLLSPLALVVLGAAVITIGFFAAHGVASGWATSTGQNRHRAASQASTHYLLAYYLGSSVFGAFGTGLWGAGQWPAVAALATVLILIAAAISAAQLASSRTALATG